jgi:Raf kinase inhibitor-like YbhB/YbcL family protein
MQVEMKLSMHMQSETSHGAGGHALNLRKLLTASKPVPSLRTRVAIGVIASMLLLAVNRTSAAGFEVTSPSFTDGGMLTAANAASANGCGGQNVSPGLEWSGAPPSTKSFAVVMFDPDGAKGLGVVHWVAYDIPASRSAMAEGEGGNPSGHFTGGRNTSGTTAYRGPCPPLGDNPHHYVISVYALDLPPGTLTPGISRDELLAAIRPHVLAEASIVSRYSRNPLVGAKPAVPGARNVDHVGVTVPNLEQAISFFVEVIGADLLWKAGRLKEDAKHSPTGQALIVSLAMLRLGPNLNLELLQYDVGAEPNQQMPKITDLGATHIAFYVTDIDKASAYLKTKGVRLLPGPVDTIAEPKRGERIQYFLAPWGMYLELVWRPEHLPYEKGTNARLYGPAPGWR